ncbi:hypothetical protein [Escherichia coli]|jgi:hypothetical protein|uniref:hypothetical protein n=1 Tax=Escherichia coli TaxID=562 RepID=UPI0009872CE2|nr:hypothetical protein [Escherichia coli]EFS3846944.1 hypothetical protein [Shigella sonnei]HAY5296460.1 hypothetical protein [Shigella flexneri]HBY5976419.1 hypothetical protein [Klebsiella pneumoniae]MDF7106279.1 hypothetical protein [Escherichia coli]HAH9702412.1 hypothetical protein [Escherichia coli]
MARLPYIESTTQQIFIFNTLTLCTIGLIHIETGKKYVVVFTDNNKIRDYKNGVVEELGEITQEDIELIEYYAKKYEKYFDNLKIGEESLNLKEYIECMQ